MAIDILGAAFTWHEGSSKSPFFNPYETAFCPGMRLDLGGVIEI
jgi:hypothetical protein